MLVSNESFTVEFLESIGSGKPHEATVVFQHGIYLVAGELVIAGEVAKYIIKRLSADCNNKSRQEE